MKVVFKVLLQWSVLLLLSRSSYVDSQEAAKYQLSFDWEVIGCPRPSNITRVATLRVFLRFLYYDFTDYVINVSCENTTLTFDFEAPEPLSDDFAPEFQWMNTPPVLENDTCCWSVSNVKILKKANQEVWGIKICNQQPAYDHEYKGKQWVCPQAAGNGQSQIQFSSDVPIITAGVNGDIVEIEECYTNSTEPVVTLRSSELFEDERPCESPARRITLFIQTLNEIRSSPMDGLRTLTVVVYQLSFKQVMYLLDIAINTPSDESIQDTINKLFLNVTNALLQQASSISNVEPAVRPAVLHLLLSLDQLALTVVRPTGGTIQAQSFSLNVLAIEQASHAGVVGIEVQNNSITLPTEIFLNNTDIRVGSFFFPNLSHLLPPLDTDSSIISPIISSTIDCQSCPVTDLTENVTVQLQIEVGRPWGLPSMNYDGKISCVFLNYETQDGFLPSGDWNTSGCTTTVNGDLVTCSCNHLTHFAILLSPGGPEISDIHYDVLHIIGLVLEPISLLCMVLVILTYTLIRSLWSIRNYVHIMLCASLFMAHLVFIIGMDKIENQGACSAVAVILLYLFLVTFMWMLMEGVVLYITLVRVLITNHKYYIIAFTVASYVIPAVYMALVTPIGYLVNIDNIPDHTHFLHYQKEGNASYLSACWLNYSTGFIWSFIAPVIVIIMINIVFFIMAIVIAKRHSKKQTMGVEIRHWILVAVSLTTVLGPGWAVGVLAFRQKLSSVTYLITIFIAAQGIILFIILVPLSKQVRNSFKKMFTKQKRQLTVKLTTYRMSSKTSMMSSNSDMRSLGSGGGTLERLVGNKKKDRFSFLAVI